mmetsp:Transcript_19476/g.54196  ORF Transcript_19476/g.54196 Transcript_19476/m.54196 type:complete len:372 (-) Transcript_19476:490-1605(-)|eukprot:CAMPEP_0117680382 /NCGR_PEP_ID=MMETSP0804-20121206/18322_1 /TAXON_ID=1074897 /ORGANISM="Tetraselmis astigmatica, Strain CCMP880" /LENGTH=371 /DNA_ID=CAMNT_0005489875 /DNA_START=305 /DNA_END=1420 /DNA_ORIENTATION=+
MQNGADTYWDNGLDLDRLIGDPGLAFGDLNCSRAGGLLPSNVVHVNNSLPTSSTHLASSSANSGPKTLAQGSMFPLTPMARLLQYADAQRSRPQDNSFSFWRAFVAEFFSPNAIVRLSVKRSRSTTNPEEEFQSTVTSLAALPTLFHAKYCDGLKEELLCLGGGCQESCLPNGQVMVKYNNLVEEAVYPTQRVVRIGVLTVTFSRTWKIHDWDLQITGHTTMMPHWLIQTKASQMKERASAIHGNVAQALTQMSLSPLDKQQILQRACSELSALTQQMSLRMDPGCVTNEFGYTDRFMRALQLSDAAETLDDLIPCTFTPSGSQPTDVLHQGAWLAGSKSLEPQSVGKADGRQYSQGDDYTIDTGLTSVWP